MQNDFPRFLIVATGYNCEQYVERCLDSIRAQAYENYCATVVDDCSTDKTMRKVLDYDLRSINVNAAVSKMNNLGTVSARHTAIDFLNRNNPYDVIVWLDLDDALEPNALERVAQEYRDTGCWLTYGNYINSDGVVPFTAETLPFPDHIHEANAYRDYDWRFMHLRTFRRELYERLTESDLFPVGDPGAYQDASQLYCMLEMAGKQRIGVIPDVLYRYNTHNPISVMKRYSPAERRAQLDQIKAMPRKSKLLTL